MKLFFLSIALLTIPLAHPRSHINSVAKEAEAYFHVGNNTEALSSYHMLLNENISPIERAIVLTNIAEIMLSEGVYDKAQSYCSKALEITDIPPHVSTRTLYIRATSIALSNHNTDDMTSVKKSLSIIHEGLADIERARQTFLAAAALYGDEDAAIPEQYTAVISKLRTLTASLFEKEEVFLLKSQSFDDERVLLEKHVDKLVEKSASFVSATIEKELLDRHIGAFINSEASWGPLWKSIRDKSSSTHKEMISECYRHYNAALDAMALKNALKSHKELATTSLLLKSISPEYEQSPQEKSNDENKNDTNTSEKEESSTRNTTPEDVMLLLQQMDHDDTIRPPQNDNKNEVIRPW